MHYRLEQHRRNSLWSLPSRFRPWTLWLPKQSRCRYRRALNPQFSLARHRDLTAHARARYRCFLPDLAGLARVRRVRPMPDLNYSSIVRGVFRDGLGRLRWRLRWRFGPRLLLVWTPNFRKGM